MEDTKTQTKNRMIRCAIYTRTSSDEALDQAFNSLDAQYEACHAYITSQKAEGWRCSNKRYDDGGVSGGTLERPGLKALLSDVEAGLVDMVVLYKIDRLTRSLADFARIVDRLDALNASFVSVTQSFNTATSMGRLTLNMLLSFAQFEREVTAERIRDKIAASKQKGFWMGGTIPLGYEPDINASRRTLQINLTEAQTVRTIYEAYDQASCLTEVKVKVDALGLRSKPRHGKPGAIFSRGALHRLLTNPLYQGKIAHKDKLYDGLHEAIIEPDIWERVQSKLKAKSARRRGTHNDPDRRVWLKGRLYDEAGVAMMPTHTSKTDPTGKSSDTNGKKRIFRYYMSRTPSTDKASSVWRLPAKTIHQLVQDAVLAHIAQLATSTALPPTSIHEVKARQEALREWQAEIDALQMPLEDTGTHPTPATNVGASKAGAGTLLCQLPRRVVLGTNSLTITLNPSALAQILSCASDDIPDTVLTFTVPTTLRRRGVEGRLICGATQPEPDVALQRALAKAHIWHQALKDGTPLKHIAKSAQTSESYIRTRLVLATLSPKIQNAILQGTQPTELTIASIIKRRIPLDWKAQEQMLGL